VKDDFENERFNFSVNGLNFFSLLCFVWKFVVCISDAGNMIQAS
jgi:hypothetical protein